MWVFKTSCAYSFGYATRNTPTFYAFRLLLIVTKRNIADRRRSEFDSQRDRYTKREAVFTRVSYSSCTVTNLYTEATTNANRDYHDSCRS